LEDKRGMLPGPGRWSDFGLGGQDEDHPSNRDSGRALVFANDSRPRFTPFHVVRRALTATCGLLVLVVMQAFASVMPGDNFTLGWTATAGPNAGATGSASVTIGAAQASPFFGIASVDVTVQGVCGVCTPLTEDLSGARFDSATFGVLGHITGSFLGKDGGTHTFDLLLNDIVGGVGTFTFSEDNAIVVDSGTYTPPAGRPLGETVVAAVDEPSAMALLALGLAGIAASRRRKRFHSSRSPNAPG